MTISEFIIRWCVAVRTRAAVVAAEAPPTSHFALEFTKPFLRSYIPLVIGV